ncbi:hypothetical protein BWI97_26145 [Siphonobacter sp. BAB-5405]|uniref:GLPGLI family protein n=1 Tax=Siphonobacter sp. BAB-5405 TaxID=1864825 RepID=UPI000C8040C7|nr:GLPGLI family protein [Siphonobacter sp. BAB-5405]PMD86669.1 hypothetical protein BWI97_26145 [Siphonobacter sp. BAB-5405]
MRLFVLFLTVFVREAVAQSFSGVAVYRVETRLKPDTTQSIVKTCELRFHAQQSEFRTVDAKLGVHTQNTQLLNTSGTQGIYKDFAQNRMLAPESSRTRKYCVEDSLKPIPWEISSQRRNIGEWQCQSARAKVRGREYEVWFAPDIPLQDGPWKLYGLPGLIVEARSTDRQVVMVLEKYALMDHSLTLRPACPFGSPRNVNSPEFARLLEEDLRNYDKMMNARPLPKPDDQGNSITSLTYRSKVYSIDVYPFQLETAK